MDDSRIFKECLIVSLRTNDNSLIRTIDRIYKSQDQIFILDRSSDKIFIFDTYGKYQNNIHKIGQGPREYISLMDFYLDDALADEKLSTRKPSE
ncbi:6-bladed beta-propeller [Proteiniphilum sp.]|uniref:6-bladed beta-propeller n=1 Tax=Proteiniphilum sp. TaxID=1926877 RepID=UPI003A598A10